jgi:hypothetical protein
MMSWGIWLKIEGIIDPFVRPQTGHRDHSVVDLAKIP